MILVMQTKMIDLSKFDGVRCDSSFFEDGYVVEAIRHQHTNFVARESIAKFKTEKSASLLISAIASKMADGFELFNLDEWAKDFCGKDYYK